MTRSDPAAGSAPLAAEIRTIGEQAGLAAVGFCAAEILEPARTVLHGRRAAGLAGSMQFTYRNPDRSTDPERVLPGARTLVAGAWNYRREAPDRPSGSSPTGRVAAYARRDHYAELRARLELIAERLRLDGHRAVVLADQNHIVDRAVAWRSGIGWFGKNANVLVPGHGSWVVLGVVVTDADLADTTDPVPDGCGPCRRCLDECPTAAILAPGVVDARRCLAWSVQAAEPIPIEQRVPLGDRLYGCDECQDVCPPSIGADRAAPPPAEADQLDHVDLLELLDLDDAELMARHGRWYLAGRDPDVVRRTALVILGNVADPGDPTVIGVLERYATSSVAELRRHARWSLRRLGADAVLAAVGPDEDPDVEAEARIPVPNRSAGAAH